MAKRRSIEVKIKGERHRFRGEERDTVILNATTDEPISIKVKEENFDPIRKGQTLVFYGNWGRYRGERQFRADTYGDPEQAKLMEQVMVMTDGRKFPLNISKLAVDKWGKNAAAIIYRDPFHLLPFSRVGFKIADALYLHLGRPPGKLKRQLLCGHYELTNNGNGSIWFLRKQFDKAIRTSIQGAEPQCDKALALGLRAGVLERERTDQFDQFDWDGSREWITTGVEAEREEFIAQQVAKAMREDLMWPPVFQGAMSDHQFDCLDAATGQNIGGLCGGGGVGKTFVVAELIRSLLDQGFPPNLISILAPTGRAAVRVTESLRELGLRDPELRGRTIHSALGFRGHGFTVDRLDAEVIIVDEMSMVDQRLMYEILRTRPDGCPLLMVGDPYQLPPVGPGAPFRDLLTTVNHGILTEVRRNSGTIAETAAAIRAGEDWEADDDFKPKEGKNHFHVDAKDDQEQILYMSNCIKRIADVTGADRVWEIQVIAQINKKSDLSASVINDHLQDWLNADNPAINGCVFRVADKVICNQNSWLIPAERWCDDHGVSEAFPPEAIVHETSGNVYVANGEIGEVLEVDVNPQGKPIKMFVRMRDPVRYVMAPLQNVEEGSEEGQTGATFQLAYCITTHKSQGSQFPYVIGMIDGGGAAKRLADRSLWYTMVTRTSKGCVTIGRKEVIRRASERSAIDDRKTFLVEKLTKEMAK